MKWKPVLDESGKKAASEKLEEISNVLLNNRDLFEKDKVGLLNGKAGAALFLFYYARYVHSKTCHNHAFKMLSDIFDMLGGEHDFHSYAGGLAGVGWLVEHLVQNDFLNAPTDEMLAEVDPVIYQLMIKNIKEGQYDFLHFATGHAIYFLSRLPNSASKEYLDRFVDELESISIKDEGRGIKWRDCFSRGVNEKGSYNLGMAHGIPAIVVFLGKMVKQDTAGEKSLQLLNGAVEYILGQSLDREKYGCYFPTRVVEGEHPTHSRLAWCYGDLGVSVALWQVSQVTGNKEWEKKAVEVLLYATKRKNPGIENVADAGLCHGTAGIAHIYNRMFHSTGIEAFKETVEYWMRQTLRMATFDDGLAGYKKSVSPEKDGWENSASVLGGIAGIGLVLISAISDIESKWDECLLLS